MLFQQLLNQSNFIIIVEPFSSQLTGIFDEKRRLFVGGHFGVALKNMLPVGTLLSSDWKSLKNRLS